MTDLTAPVLTAFTVMFALGITAPLWSVTIPLIEPVVDCPRAVTHSPTAKIAIKMAFHLFCVRHMVFFPYEDSWE
jgi:hypothetical protein